MGSSDLKLIPSPEVTVLQDAPKLPDRFTDESYKLFSQVSVEDLTPEEARRIRNKCVWRILSFICLGYHIMYVDKQTLGNSSILGILEDAHLTTEEYNWLSSIFYFGYLLAEWPQNWALQRFPVGKWLAVNLVIWGGITFLHIPCTNFAGLFVARFFLGTAEACIVPAFLLTLSMFFTYNEQAILIMCLIDRLASLNTPPCLKPRQHDVKGLPWSDRWGLVSAIWIRAPGGIPYAVVMIWAANASAGHTKKITVIALYHIGYGLGNILSPQLFQARWKPRYYPTWGIILGVASVFPMFLVLYLHHYLVRENNRRDAIAALGQVQNNGVVETVEEDGTTTAHVVDNRLDLTDRENLTFRYVL